MKSMSIQLDSRYESLITEAIRDKQHLVNNLIIIYNKTKSKQIKKEITNYMIFKKVLNGSISNLKYLRHYPDQWKVIMNFRAKYTYDVFFDIIKEFGKNVSTNLSKGSYFRMKTKRLNKVKTGSILLAENNTSYNNGSGGRKRLYKREFGLALFNQKYLKERYGHTTNLKVYFNDSFMTNVDEFRTATLVKKYNQTFLSIQYKEREELPQVWGGKYTMAIDPGVKNALTIVSDNPEAPSLLIRNHALNHLFRTEYKFMDDLQGWRKDNFYAKIWKVRNNELNKLANRMVEYCQKYRIGKIIMGSGYQAKKSSDIWKKTTRKNHSFPHYTLLTKLKERCSKLGIEVVIQEESYTSKVSCLAEDGEIWNYVKGETVPPESILSLGTRSTRSNFKHYLSPTKSVIFNADVNGAFNILMKHLRKRIHISHESLFHPIKVKNDFEFCDIINSPMR